MSEIQVTETLMLTVHDTDQDGGPAVVIRRTDDSDEQITIYAQEIRHLVGKLPEAAVQIVDRGISVDGTNSGNGDYWADSK